MKRNRVFINGRFLEQRVTGVQRFALEVLRALDELLDEQPESWRWDVALLSPSGSRRLKLRRIAARQVGPLRGHAWEQMTLPLAAGRSLLVGFGPTGPLSKRDQVVTIHDAAVRVVPATYSRRFRGWYNVLLPRLVRRTPAVMTPSRFSRDELVRHFGARPEQVRVTGEGWEHVRRITPDASILARHGLVPHRYLLAVSSVTPSKNLAVVVRAAKRLQGAGVVVAVAGAVDPRLFGAVSIPAGVLRQLGYVSDEELGALYANAAAFVFPSLYEGFGLPPLEAMALGCPVLSSNAASLPEVCGDAALYFDPSDDATLAGLMRRVMMDDAERARLVLRGTARLGAHGWRSAAFAYWSLMKEWFDGGLRDSDLVETS